MAALSTSEWIVLGLIVAGTLWGVLRTLTGARAARGWRLGARVLLNLGVGVALAALLFVSAGPAAPARALWVLAPGGVTLPLPTDPQQVRVRLPGAATADASVTPMPDLATALRRHAPLSRVQVVGHGLAAHDRSALQAAAVPVHFDPVPLPDGVVDLVFKGTVLVGRDFTVRGRWAQTAAVAADTLEAELLSPGGQRVDRVVLGASGRFTLRGIAPVTGALDWTLRVRTVASADREPRTLETVVLPVVVEATRATRVQVLSGGPDPDLKYLRRWALDAGLELRSRVLLSSGIGVSGATPPAPLDAAGLDALDMLILDERSWANLSAADREQVLAAVRRGLGLLLRLRSLPPAAIGGQWAQLGITWKADPELESAVTVRRRFDLPDTAADLNRLRLALTAPLATPLLTDDRGQPLALAQPLGRGRIGTLWLLDSFRLRLGGHAPAHAGLWSTLVEGIARAQATAAPVWSAPPRMGERAVVCGLVGTDPADQWRITGAPGTEAVVLVPVPSTGSAGACAAWWPRAAGWHRLQHETDGSGFDVAVQPADATPAQTARDRQAATAALAASGAFAPVVTARATREPWPRWLWLVLVVMACSVLWALERTRPAGARTARR